MAVSLELAFSIASITAIQAPITQKCDHPIPFITIASISVVGSLLALCLPDSASSPKFNPIKDLNELESQIYTLIEESQQEVSHNKDDTSNDDDGSQ